jgi:hypothetical protein
MAVARPRAPRSAPPPAYRASGSERNQCQPRKATEDERVPSQGSVVSNSSARRASAPRRHRPRFRVTRILRQRQLTARPPACLRFGSSSQSDLGTGASNGLIISTPIALIRRWLRVNTKASPAPAARRRGAAVRSAPAGRSGFEVGWLSLGSALRSLAPDFATHQRAARAGRGAYGEQTWTAGPTACALPG